MLALARSSAEPLESGCATGGVRTRGDGLVLSLLWIGMGLAMLWGGAQWALRGTIVVAEGRNLSQGFLGITVLAIGTDLPEFVVAVGGGIRQLGGADASGVVVGNAVGSALAQGTLVLGLAGLLGRLHLSRSTLRRDGTVLVVAVVLLFLLAGGGSVSRAEGAALVAVYVVYSWTLGASERRRPPSPRVPWRKLRPHLVAIGGGLVIVLSGAHLVLEHSLRLAGERGWDQTVIGLFLVGACTSLPELALTLGAAIEGRGALALGNVIGSNVFDLLIPVGVSALLHPLGVERETMRIDLPALFLLTLLALTFLFRRRLLHRWEAGALVVGYLVYAAVRLTNTF